MMIKEQGICDDENCELKIHWYKPELSSAYTHKIITRDDGSYEWIPVRAILKKKGPRRCYYDENDPLDMFHYEIQWDSSEGEDNDVEYIEQISGKIT